jgi:hypothetical protein
MKRENDFYYFLSFMAFYTIILLWYSGYIINYEEMLVPSSSAIGEHTYVAFIFKVILSFPFGIISWLNDDPLNVVYYFIGALFYSYLFYRIYFKNLSKLLWVMVLLNIMAAIFLLSFYAENPIINFPA